MSYISGVPNLDNLPGAALVLQGLSDARDGKETIESLLVAIASPRLVWLGLDVPDGIKRLRNAEVLLYGRLADSGVPDPYGRYNALLRELVSFERALEHRVMRQAKSQGSR